VNQPQLLHTPLLLLLLQVLQHATPAWKLADHR
jgi:hypothetical protein